MKKESTEIERNRVRVVSLFPDVSSREIVLKNIRKLVKRGKGGYVCLSTAHMVMESYDDADFGRKVNGADFIITDGTPLVLMQRFQGLKNAKRVRGNDLMILLCEYAAQNGLKVGFYGGKQEVIDTILRKAKIDFPEVEIAYAYSPPFRNLTNDEDAEIVEKIKRSGAQILFLGLGCPKQENWMADHIERLPVVMLGVGAAFDFYVGNIRESPKWIRSIGLEWLFRLTQEPRRLWRRYLILNPRFMWLALLQLLGLKKFDE